MKDKWERYCAMTCLGGSEEKGCPCKSPMECELQDDPEFAEQSKKSSDRMWRFLLCNLGKTAGQA